MIAPSYSDIAPSILLFLLLLLFVKLHSPDSGHFLFESDLFYGIMLFMLRATTFDILNLMLRGLQCNSFFEFRKLKETKKPSDFGLVAFLT